MPSIDDSYIALFKCMRSKFIFFTSIRIFLLWLFTFAFPFGQVENLLFPIIVQNYERLPGRENCKFFFSVLHKVGTEQLRTWEVKETNFCHFKVGLEKLHSLDGTKTILFFKQGNTLP